MKKKTQILIKWFNEHTSFEMFLINLYVSLFYKYHIKNSKVSRNIIKTIILESPLNVDTMLEYYVNDLISSSQFFFQVPVCQVTDKK